MKMLERFTNLRPMTQKTTLVDISNVARWFFEESGKEGWDANRDFPVIVPPWPRTWFEFGCPKRIRVNNDMLSVTDVSGVRFGVYMATIEIPEEASTRVLKDDFLIAQIKRYYPGNIPPIGSERGERTSAAVKDGARCRWVTIWNMYMAKRSLVPIGLGIHYVDYEGKNIDGAQYGLFAKEIGGDQWASMGIMATLFAISLLHCKNVELVNEPISKKASKRQGRNGDRVIYKTLVIEPLKKQIRNENHGEKTNIHRALHICRGHFATYTEERPLFGKLSGTFWIPMHVKGDKKYGEVKKDYQVKP